MIFSELYSAYYNTVAGILKAAVARPISTEELRGLIEKNAFGESGLMIEPAFAQERWQLLRRDGTTPIVNVPTMPLTTLEKRWLKAIFADPRIRLFTDEPIDLPGVEPLFGPEDICVFDKYSDGDPYEDAEYIRVFRFVLDAVRKRSPISVDTMNRKGGINHMVMMPEYLEYSEKDDKFRLIGSGNRFGNTVNLARIVCCKPYTKPFADRSRGKARQEKETVEFELYDRRKALERALMHFAHFEKQAERLDEDRYKVSVTYDKDDETELVIRVLSFGPMIKVTSPQSFVDLIKDRLKKQMSCGL